MFTAETAEKQESGFMEESAFYYPDPMFHFFFNYKLFTTQKTVAQPKVEKELHAPNPYPTPTPQTRVV